MSLHDLHYRAALVACLQLSPAEVDRVVQRAADEAAQQKAVGWRRYRRNLARLHAVARPQLEGTK